MKWKSNPLEFVARVNAGQAPEMAICRNGPSRSLVRQRDPCSRHGCESPSNSKRHAYNSNQHGFALGSVQAAMKN
jgi:hypothetical protein